MKRKRLFFSGAMIFLMLCSNLFAQTTGKISGTITDRETSAPLPGANIVIEGTNRGAAAELDGSFFILNIPPGSYNIKVMMMGYETMVFENLLVSVNRTSYIHAKMNATVLHTGESIIVQADRIATKKDQTSSIRNVSAEDIELLPVESTGAVVNLQAGVVQGHFRGGRSGEVSYMIDGMQIDNALNRGRTVDIDVEAVQDLEVITGTFNAEYGRAMSGVVNLITKEGGNDFHGSVSGYQGNYYTTHDHIFWGLEPGEINRNQDYRCSIEGPVWKNRIFFNTNVRYQNNKGHLMGIRRFNVTDLSDFTYYPNNYISQATGDSAEVPMNRSENLNISGKFSFKFHKNLMASLFMVYNDDVWHGYSHQYKYAPDGRNKSYRTSQMYTFQLNHLLATNAFYELKFSYTNNYSGWYLYKNPLDSRYISDTFHRGTSQTGFWTGGQEKGHSETTIERIDAKWDLTWQATKAHSFKTGVLYTIHKFDSRYQQILNRYRDTEFEEFFYEPEVMPDSSVYADIYYKEPIELAAYLQDKMEFDAMVINLGVRFEYFDPKTIYPTQLRNPGNMLDFPDNPEKMSEYPDTKPKTSLSPRFGLSYQIGKTALLRFSYGHFLQFPPFNSMYQNNSYVLGPTSYETTIGNPRVNPEKTVNYEVGYWQEITSYMDCEVALFYKDIYDLSTVNLFQTYNGVWYGVYSNKDYGNARGLEVKLNMKWNQIYFSTNYTLQYTRGNADNPRFTFNRAGNSQDPIPTLIPMSWDQRHTANFTLGYNTKNYGATATAYYGSGGIYTWSAIPENRLSRVNLYPNNSYKISTFSVDARAYYKLGTFVGLKTRLVLQIYNLLDNLNEYGVNGQTGRANQAIIRKEDLINHKSDFNTYEDRINNPANFSAPRQIKMGIELSF